MVDSLCSLCIDIRPRDSHLSCHPSVQAHNSQALTAVFKLNMLFVRSLVLSALFLVGLVSGEKPLQFYACIDPNTRPLGFHSTQPSLSTRTHLTAAIITTSAGSRLI